MRSKASAVTWAEGLAAAQSDGTRVHPAARPASTKPDAPTFTFATPAKTFSPRDRVGQPPPCRKASNPARLGAKVFVSCRKPPKAMRGDMNLVRAWRCGASIRGAADRGRAGARETA